jgi:sec-independent protein translocase protein TatA
MPFKPYRSLRIGPVEIIIILVIILILFGVGKLPQVGEAIGKGIKSFRMASSGEEEDKGKKKKATRRKKKAVAKQPTADVATEKTEENTSVAGEQKPE